MDGHSEPAGGQPPALLLPLYLEIIRGPTPVQTGLLLIPQGLAAYTQLTASTAYWYLAAALLLIGAGMGRPSPRPWRPRSRPSSARPSARPPPRSGPSSGSPARSAPRCPRLPCSTPWPRACPASTAASAARPPRSPPHHRADVTVS